MKDEKNKGVVGKHGRLCDGRWVVCESLLLLSLKSVFKLMLFLLLFLLLFSMLLLLLLLMLLLFKRLYLQRLWS